MRSASRRLPSRVHGEPLSEHWLETALTLQTADSDTDYGVQSVPHEATSQTNVRRTVPLRLPPTTKTEWLFVDEWGSRSFTSAVIPVATDACAAR